MEIIVHMCTQRKQFDWFSNDCSEIQNTDKKKGMTKHFQIKHQVFVTFDDIFLRLGYYY